MSLFFQPYFLRQEEEPYLYIYHWYYLLPSEIIEEFERETGIKVIIDFYDDNAVLEAKLLTGSIGYDLVAPSRAPYLARQLKAGLYQPLQWEWLPHRKEINPHIVHFMQEVDPNLTYSIPYYYGTLGFAYIVEEVEKRVPGAPLKSQRMIFDPDIVGRLRGCGISFLTEPVDIFPPVLKYLGKDPQHTSFSDIDQAYHHLKRLRPFITRFSGSRFANDLIAKEVCLAQAWSTESHLVKKEAEQLGLDYHIEYQVPEEGTAVWIDAFAIPKGARHVRNAHKFLTFIMRPDIAARIVEKTRTAVCITKAQALVPEEIRSNEAIFLSKELMEKSFVDSAYSLDLEKYQLKLWKAIRYGV